MNRYVIVSSRELDMKSFKDSKEFLYYAYSEFRHNHPRLHPDNLVMMWQSDFDKLRENGRGELDR